MNNSRKLRGLHDRKAEYEGDAETFANHVASVTKRTGHSHDESHVNRHDNARDPKCLLPSPTIDEVQTDHISNWTNHTVDTRQQCNLVTHDTKSLVQIRLVIIDDIDTRKLREDLDENSEDKSLPVAWLCEEL